MADVRLAWLSTHPIQYQAPLLRAISATPGIELTVLFFRVPRAAISLDTHLQ